ncbi:GNAT family N-acetyltransferase [Vibrio fluvialis]|nr:tRNA(Met) cytidine acetyltransferase [Vibrio fluvialis]MBY8221372.1 GNAT family N-acetyltransferase [Vibrio fluvialis]
MANSTPNFLQFFEQLQQLAAKQRCRFGIRLQGGSDWQQALVQQILNQQNAHAAVFQLGGEPNPGVTHVAAKKGQFLLGRECQLLICDVSDEFDANSFSAALGTLVGGGMLLVIGADACNENPAQKWLTAALSELLVVTPTSVPVIPAVELPLEVDAFAQQTAAVAQIVRVIEGHRKRPLVLTADRGRGKSSALGIATAQLMQSRSLNIVLTAPTLSAVAPVFHHASRLLPLAQMNKGDLCYGESRLSFMAPDDIIANLPECDLLLVDEAAALPLPFLMAFVSHYHRAVFSTTIHGYEGCGRGFTLKFQQWLQQERPQARALHLDQPIRWNLGDPLEAWHRRAFLLDYEFELLPDALDIAALTYQSISKQQLLADRELLSSIFSLLVNAHYQTSPNDLFHLLGDDAMSVFIAKANEQVVGCILAVREGGLDAELVQQIQLGQRRPRGHLAPVTLANQLGFSEAAAQTCLRVMRIAVHPQVQDSGIGSQLLSQFFTTHHADYFATSFGATDELVHFWQRNQFQAMKMGSQRDQASGCYSLLMVKSANAPWTAEASSQFKTHFRYELKDTLRTLTPALVRRLMSASSEAKAGDIPIGLLEQYSYGGANFESVGAWIEQLLLGLTQEQWQQVPDLLIAKVLQQRTWQECAKAFGLAGRKQVEQEIRTSLAKLLTNLHCKTTE